MDETWIHHYIPESNRLSAEWREAGESRSKRVKASRWADFFTSEMAVLSSQFKLMLEEVGQQKIQIAQLLRKRSEAEGLSSLFRVASEDELKCLDLQIEQELFCK
ncbi:hypothetical protein ACLKA6_016685 [Drosophila palustris]